MIGRKQNGNVSFINVLMIDRDVWSILFPLHWVQNIIFCPKFCIRGDFISTNSFLQSLVSLLETVCLWIVFLHSLNMFVCDHAKMFIKLYISATFDCIFNCLGFTMNLIVSFFQIKNNVKFILIFQKVHRILNSFKNNAIWNLFSRLLQSI